MRYLVLPAERFKSAAGVDDAAGQAYYKAHQAEYMTPESAHLEYAQLSLAALEAQVTASDADLRAAYEKAKGRLEVPEKRHARHVLITGKDDAAALVVESWSSCSRLRAIMTAATTDVSRSPRPIAALRSRIWPTPNSAL